MQTWTFTIGGELIPNGWEPVGWDKVKFTLRRAMGDNGYDFTFTDTLKFDGRAAQIVRAAYQEAFIDAYVSISIAHCQGWTYNGVLNFTFYKEEPGYVTAGIKESSFSNLFTTRYDTPVDMSRELSIDGLPLTPISPIDLALHSKEVFYTANYLINAELKGPVEIPFVEEDYKITPPFQVTKADIMEYLEPGDYNGNNPFFYSGFTYPGTVTNRQIHVYGRLKFTINALFGGTLQVRFVIKGVQSAIETTVLVLIEQVLEENTPTVFDVFFDELFNFPVDSNLFFQIRINSDASEYSILVEFDDTVSAFNMEENSLFPESTAKAYLIYEALNRVVESITGTQNAIVSDFFGRTDSLPIAYDTDGTGALVALTNGFAIRKFEGRPVVTSFKQLFEGLNAIYNLGMRVEGQQIRIEPKQYFYRLTPIARFSFVKDISEAVSLSDIYSEIEFSYSNQGDTQQVNRLDEFNTKRNYVTPIRQHKQKLTITTDVITSGYAIEFTRRQQYKTSPTTDYPTDDNVFFIALVREGESFIAEKDENYLPVENLISPSTAYNLRFAPVRCLHRWEKVFAGCLFRSADKVVKFQAGTGNYRMQSGGIAENENISADTANALFIPIEAQFEYPLSFGEFLALKDKSIYALEYSCSKTNYQPSYIREVSYEPNREGGVASFKLIQANASRNESLEDV